MSKKFDNKSDYKKNFLDLKQYLAEVYSSELNQSIIDNLYNRFLSKEENVIKAGYVGLGNKYAVTKRQIEEDDVHRQAFQLQPIVTKKIGSIEHMYSWKDFESELKRLNVDINKIQDWGSLEKFNFVPPIDIDKLINYQNYYWVKRNKEGKQTPPQYITVRNKCSIAISKLNFWQTLILQYGNIFPVLEILESDLPPSIYNIELLDSVQNIIKISGDKTSEFYITQRLEITKTDFNNGYVTVISAPVYDGTTNTTSIYVDNIVTNETKGELVYRKYNKLRLGGNSTTIDGDYTDLFVKDFVFFVKQFSNDEINNSFLKTVSSTYDKDTQSTIVEIDTIISNNDAGGVASLDEQERILIANKNCLCDLYGGWDSSLWDDNPQDPLWGDDVDANWDPISDGIPDFDNFINRITNSGPPTSTGVDYQLWHDSLNNVLYQYKTGIGWKAIWKNFDLLLENTKGYVLWDGANPCDTRPYVKQIEQWSKDNRWLHKNDVKNFADVTRAKMPIIEYDWDIELNEWTYTKHLWKYRKEPDASYEPTDVQPPRIELEPLVWWQLANPSDINDTTVEFDSRYGDMTEYFTSGRKIRIVDDAGYLETYTVVRSYYKQPTNDDIYRTYVIFDKRPNISTGNFSIYKPNVFKIIPYKTIFDGIWFGYGLHWKYNGFEDAVAHPHVDENIFASIKEGSFAETIYDGSGNPMLEVLKRQDVQQFIVVYPTPVDTFMFVDEFYGNETLNSRRRALYGYDNIAVYTLTADSEIPKREYGTYDEIGEAAIKVIGVDTTSNEFILGGIDNTSTYFNTGDEIELYGNTDIGLQTYTISSVAPSTPNRIRVIQNLGTSMTPTGEIRNLTNPLPADDFVNNRYVTVYAVGVKFYTPIQYGQAVLIKFNNNSMIDYGTSNISVRFDESDVDYNVNGDIPISLIAYRKKEQVKIKSNQYPLFDIYTVKSQPAYRANPIFGFREDKNYPINLNIGKRIVYSDRYYEFEQFILDEDNGKLFAFKNYSNKKNDYWFNTDTKTLYFWNGLSWTDKTDMDGYYRKAVVSNTEPESYEKDINGLYWFNTGTKKLYKRFIHPITAEKSWIEITNVNYGNEDETLQTIWRSGTVDKLYVPQLVDWERRTLAEYTKEKQDYINSVKNDLIKQDPSLPEDEAIRIATEQWYETQSNNVSPSGTWIGDWEIPDPLYYNSLNENKKYLSNVDLYSHFQSIIKEQELIPGYSGDTKDMISLLHMTEIDYGKGGTIKEFNDGFDILLSSLFVDNLTPVDLILFARNQYDNLLNTIKEILKEQFTGLALDLDPNNIVNFEKYINDTVISLFEKNEFYNRIYGDSTTFTDNKGEPDKGLRNWIATLPYLGLVKPTIPLRIKDDKFLLNGVVHHDGHIHQYGYEDSVVDIIYQLLISHDDPRTINDNTVYKIGYKSSLPVPNNSLEFKRTFGDIANRQGVYWYYSNGTDRKLYRFSVVESGSNEPSASYPDSSLWFDTTNGDGTLRIKKTLSDGTTIWDIVDGISDGDGRLHNGSDPNDITTAEISAWKIVDINNLINDIIFNVEVKLYENVPEYVEKKLDFDEIEKENSTDFNNHLELQYIQYVIDNEYVNAYINRNYDVNNAFTWNYLRSTQGASFDVLYADGLTNSFVVEGDKRNYFDPCQSSASCPSTVTFYIKNSKYNSGTWTTIESNASRYATFYDNTTNTTTIFVDGDVKTDTTGQIYLGLLPSPKTSSQYNLNDGSESAADWKELYNQLYNTPFPHLTPWRLQGYRDKPIWWDEEYYNDDPKKWGNRRWKYKHGFDLKDIYDMNDDVSGNHSVMEIEGDFLEAFDTNENIYVVKSSNYNGLYTTKERDFIIDVLYKDVDGLSAIKVNSPSLFALSFYKPGMKIQIVERTVDINLYVYWNTIKTYTVDFVTNVGNEVTIRVKEDIFSGEITPNTNFYIGANVYDKDRNVTIIKLNSAISGLPVDGLINKKYGMWENIRTGKIPAGREYPNGVKSITGVPSQDRNIYDVDIGGLPTFNYFSVNISNSPVSSDFGVTVYNPDDVFPPFWDFTKVFGTSPNSFDLQIRSVFYSYSTEIKNPSADFSFGDVGGVEWLWRNSTSYNYDRFIASFKVQPVKSFFRTFGFDIVKVDGLNIDKLTENVPSHNRVIWHGDIFNNDIFKVNGLNQWYVNFNRYNGIDTNYSDFNKKFVEWEPKLTYQFNSFIDTDSLSVSHRYVDINEFDYSVKIKRSPAAKELLIDSIDVTVDKMPQAISRYNNENEWSFIINVPLLQGRLIEYYDVKKYQFYPDNATNIFHIYKWKIENMDIVKKSFTIDGDFRHIFVTNYEFEIVDSSQNDGVYTVLRSEYDNLNNKTIIYIKDLIPSSIKDGFIVADYNTIDWETGDIVYVYSTNKLASPLLEIGARGLYKYFIIKISDKEFQLAETYDDAINGNYIGIFDSGVGTHYVGEVHSTFTSNVNVNSQPTLFKIYALDKRKVRTKVVQSYITGIQNLVDFIHGYGNYLMDQGWKFTDIDEDTGYVASWQNEINKFVDYIFAQRRQNYYVDEKYGVIVDYSSNLFNIVDSKHYLNTGDPVAIISDNGVYPIPLNVGIRYYVIKIDDKSFKLAATKIDALNNNAIDLSYVSGVGNLEIIKNEIRDASDIVYNLNPFKKELTIVTDRGVVSDIINGPLDDLRYTKLIYDQYGKEISDEINVFRRDKETKISYINETGRYIGGLRVFIDEYEHVLQFNNTTRNGQIIYEPFIGLNVNKFELLFNKQDNNFRRPSFGGYYMLDTVENINMYRNFELSTEKLRYAYDTFKTLENDIYTKYARKTLGYEGNTSYLDNLNLSDKSQFLFWRGYIQQKGTQKSIKAYVNSRRFIDARIDDFWAFKVGEFGNINKEEKYDIFVSETIARSNELRFEITNNETNIESSFNPLMSNDIELWNDQPDVARELSDTLNLMIIDASVEEIEDITNKLSVKEILPSGDTIYYLKHDKDTNDLQIVIEYYKHQKVIVKTISGPTTITLNSDEIYLYDGDMLEIYYDNKRLIKGVDYEEDFILNNQYMSNAINIIANIVGDITIILKKNATLKEGIHYRSINKDIIEFENIKLNLV